jgi:uncharacterized protein (DUF924 family)
MPPQTNGEAMKPSDVIDFWDHAGPKHWFAKNDRFDAQIRDRFEALHHCAARRELDDWADSPLGALALLILLDQFPRNMYRNSAHAFATDPLARQFAGAAIESGFDQTVDQALRLFFHLPFMHSEAPHDQDRAVALCGGAEAPDAHWAMLHRDIIRRFGRFPHRNAELGRDSTPDEIAFLQSGGFAG